MSTPTPPAPAAGAASSPPRPAGGLAGLSSTQLYVAAAVLVAGFAALSAWRGKKTGAADQATYTVDTSLTDVTGELQQINDRLDQIPTDNPRPAQPTPVTPAPPAKPTPAPKPGPPRDYVRYIVKTGDTIAKIAAAYHVSAANLYAWNKGTIDAGASAHHKRTHGVLTTIYPGSVLTIKTNLPGQHGVKLGF